MCTAIALTTADHYFGRNLDLEMTYDERVVLCPRAFPIPLRHLPPMTRHAALLGMAHVQDGYPLYYDAVSEHGLAMAALNFPHFCAYHTPSRDADNVAPFELIAYVLGSCRTLDEARACLSRVSLADTAFSPALPNTPLHFMLSSREGSLVIESREDGLKVYDNPANVMTNSPPFDYHMQRLCDFMNLSRDPAQNRFSSELPLLSYSRGMGAMGLPGDLSSSSRFIRAAFARANSVCEADEASSVSQLFHLLDFVAFPRGCVRLENGLFEITVYSSCMNLEKGIYYYKTYESSCVKQAKMKEMDIEGNALVSL